MHVAPLRRIAIVGGTHGNENNGTFLVEAYRRHGAEALQRPSFEYVKLVNGNPAAGARCVRFVDEDLNRSFSLESLRNFDNPSYEAARAKALNAMLGPKPGSFDAPGSPMPKSDAPNTGAIDFLIDLHTTTSNMGCSFMVSSPLALYAASYARAWLDEKGMPSKICFSQGIDRSKKGTLGSVAEYTLTIECGPTANGLVRHDIVSWMRESTERVLECLDCLNRGLPLPMPPSGTWGKTWARGAMDQGGLPQNVIVNRMVIDPVAKREKIPVPCDKSGQPTVMFAPSLQDADFTELRKGDPMFIDFNGKVTTYDGGFGDVVQPIFVNEAGYYFASSGLGFMLTVEKEVALERPIVSQKERRSRL